MNNKKSTSLLCQTCGLAPIESGSVCRCPFCLPPKLYHPSGSVRDESKDEWNARQFKARHEAIDKIVVALNGTSAGAGCKSSILSEAATQQHDANLARRRAEAEKLMDNME